MAVIRKSFLSFSNDRFGINIRELFTPSVRDASRDFSLIRPQGNLTLYKRKEKAKDRRTKGNRYFLVLQDKRSLHYIKRQGTK